MIFILSSIITLSLIYTHFYIYQYISFLSHNINIATNQYIINKVQNNVHEFATNIIIKSYMRWKFIWSPISTITIISLIIFSISPFTQFLPEILETYLPILIATTITPVITYKKPSWIQNWYHNNEIALQLIQLDQITEQLELIKSKLLEKTLPQEEINSLHVQAEFLISMSLILTENIQEHLNNIN